MPKKSTKKTTAKATEVKKTAKKAAPKKAVKPAAVKEEIKVAPMPESAPCKCGGHCNCGPDCKCAHRGSRCVRFMLKFIMILIVFALGFAAAKFVDGNRYFRGPRVDFDNGCLDVSSVKCPQMQEVLPMMDIDHDGCITHEEYRAIRKELGRQMRAGNGIERGMRN